MYMSHNYNYVIIIIFLRFVCLGYLHEHVLIAGIFIRMIYSTEFSVLSLDISLAGFLRVGGVRGGAFIREGHR